MKRFSIVAIALLVLSVVVLHVAAQDGIHGQDWSISGPVPDQVVPLKYELNEANPDSCTIPGACWFFNQAGVLGASDWDDAEANPSAIWTGGGDAQELLENETAQLPVPESGYMQVSGAGWDMDCGEYKHSFEPSPDHVWFANFRGLNDGDGDRTTMCTFSNYTSGAVLVTMYAVPVDASAFFSQGGFRDDVANALTQKNCGATGCDSASMHQFDLNNASYSTETAELVDGELVISLSETNTVTD